MINYEEQPVDKDCLVVLTGVKLHAMSYDRNCEVHMNVLGYIFVLRTTVCGDWNKLMFMINSQYLKQNTHYGAVAKKVVMYTSCW